MTTQQLGKRVGDLETDVKTLAKSVGDLATVTTTVQQQVNMLTHGQQSQSEKLDRLLSRTTGSEATKGMIPVNYVTWGVGAVLTMIGLFFTAAVIVAGVVLFAVDSGDSQTHSRIDSQSLIERAHIDHVNEVIDLRVDSAEHSIEKNTQEIRIIEKKIDDLKDHASRRSEQ